VHKSPEHFVFLHILKDNSEKNKISIALFGKDPKLVTHTETRIQPKVLENRVAREYLEIMREKER
jgi:hypothetical protein